MTKHAIEADLKNAMLAGDKQLVSALRTVKSTILDAEIKEGVRAEGLAEDKVIALLQKEAKKRGETADLYESAGDAERSANERYEQQVIQKYLPTAMSEDEIKAVIDEVMVAIDTPNPQMMGQIIGAVKAKTGPTADGGVIARLVKERL